MNWLQLIDPDFVLLLTFDNQKFLEPLTRILGDTKIQERFRSRGDEEEHPRVDIDINGLSSISLIPFLKVTYSAMRAAPELILDLIPGCNDDCINGWLTGDWCLHNNYVFSECDSSSL
jgi:hypothetical protein